MPSLFVCYRREDSAGYSAWLADRLRRKYGPERVFFDVHIAGGARFQREIERAVAGCDIVLALIGRHWLVDATGRRRLDEPGDFVYLELTAALGAGRVVIPVLVDGAALPTEGDLPEALRPLLQRQAMELSNVRGREDLERIERAIDGLLAVSHPPWWRHRLLAAGIPVILAAGGGTFWLTASAGPERVNRSLSATRAKVSDAGASEHGHQTAAPPDTTDTADQVRHAGDAAAVASGAEVSTAGVAAAQGVAEVGSSGTTQETNTLQLVTRSRSRPFDVSTLRDKLEVSTDGKGHYLALASFVVNKKGDVVPRVFWGGDRELGRVRAFTSTKLVAQANADGTEAVSEPPAEWTIGFDDPRVRYSPAGELVRRRGVTSVRCNNAELTLSRVESARASRLLDTAAFVQADYYTPYALGRSLQGEYTFVDFDQHERPRVMVGGLGKLHNVVVHAVLRADTQHKEPSFDTEHGTLVSHFVEVDEGPNYRLTWVIDGHTQDLTLFPLVENWKLIFERLGVYGSRTPSPCDAIEPM